MHNAIENTPACEKCPNDWSCCKGDVILTAEDELSGKIKCDEHGYIIRKPNGECYAFNFQTHKCGIYPDRPYICKIAACKHLIEGGISR